MREWYAMKHKGRTMQRIGDVARTGGVGVETIRFYEREGLIEQPVKPARGWREYGERQRQQLEYVRRGQEFGLALSDVRELQQRARGERGAFCGAVRETVEKRLKRIERELTLLKQKRSRLKEWLSQCKARDPSKECPLYAQLQPVVARTGRKST
jgi:MerR family mercuric resistance operon transcriptional regulator